MKHIRLREITTIITLITNLDRRSSFKHSPPRRRPPPCASHLPAGVDLATTTTTKMSRSTTVMVVTMTTATMTLTSTITTAALRGKRSRSFLPRTRTRGRSVSLVARKSGSSSSPPPLFVRRGTVLACSLPLSFSLSLPHSVCTSLSFSLPLSLPITTVQHTENGSSTALGQCLPTRALTQTTDRALVEITEHECPCAGATRS